MAFVLPTFNLTADVFTWSNPQTFVTPRLTVDCQLRAPSAHNLAASISNPGITPGMLLLVPPGTDIRDHYSLPGTRGDAIECPPGSGRRYYALVCDDIGRGFPNEHRFVVLTKIQFQWPVPTP